MNITDLFIKKPVLALVLNLLIVLFGFRSIDLLPIREYPYVENAVVTVATSYVGADPELIAGFITTPLENVISEVNGIDYLSSTSNQNVSMITANLRLGYDPNQAVSDISTKVNSIVNQLPRNSEKPVISLSIGNTIASMYIGFYSTELPRNKITDYLVRVVQPKLQVIEGVQQADILGGREFAMRIWLDPQKLAAYGLTASDVAKVLNDNAYISAIGRTDGELITVNLKAKTSLHSAEDYQNIIVRESQGGYVRLGDVANVFLGSDDYDSMVSFDGKEAVYIGIQVAPSANLLDVIDSVRKAFPNLQKELPNGLNGQIVYDATKFVNSAIHEVEFSIFDALLIVTGVVFLFLGSPRTVIIPVIAIPLSLIGALFVMYILGYSINLLTLLALVLAIGLVVDDAIIVVENIHRHIEEGMGALEAALIGTKELAMPIVAISLVLISVYVPIGFMGGLTGKLFSEFAFTLAGAVAISAIVALTLSPMMCSVFLKKNQSSTFSQRIDRVFEQLKNNYLRRLHGVLNELPVVWVFSIIVIGSIYFLYTTSRSELAPQEDKGILISFLKTQPNANIQQTRFYTDQVFEDFMQFPETEHVFQIIGSSGLNSSISGMVLKPWDDRKRTTADIQPLLQNKLSDITGGNAVVFQPPPLPGSGGGVPVQFVIGTTDSFERLNRIAENFLEKVKETGMFIFVDTDLKFDKLQVSLNFDRNKISQLGLSMKSIGDLLGSGLGGGYVNYFSLSGRSYKVIPQMLQNDRSRPEQLLNYTVLGKKNESISLATFTSLQKEVVPNSLYHFQQLNSATVSGVPMPGITLGTALEKLESIARELLPEGYSFDYGGQSRQYKQESNTFLVTFIFALMIIYLCLSALFESFIDPLIIMISVPMSICGALLFVSLGLGGLSLNIYTEVGLVTLIGLITKHGILIVQFANDLRIQGKSIREAIEIASSIRLRPILMTTAAMVLGVFPLIFASGAGAVSRFNIGVVIASGIAIGTLFTLFVLPAMYLTLAKKR